MPKQSIYRRADAQHFQLVHRSQRDPLINDPEASQRVFVPLERGNDHGRKTGQTLAELDADLADQVRKNEGEATGYGIYYDDSSYDYMQHLRPIGHAGGGDTFMLEAPARDKGKGKSKGVEAEELFKPAPVQGTLPEGVLPSTMELTREQVLARQSAVPIELQGLQPDMDPHLRQVLEALEDDAFVVGEEGEDDEEWLGELLGGGEREGEEDVEFEFAEEGIDEDEDGTARPRTLPTPSDLPPDASLESRVAAFKAQQASEPRPPRRSNAEGDSEGGDTLGELPPMSVIGGKKRRNKGEGSVASGYSMSSSSMMRNKGLSTLDEMFEKVERDYEHDDDFPDDDDEFTPSELMSDAGGGGTRSDAGSVFSMARSIASRKQGRAGPSSSASSMGFDPTDVVDNPPELSRDDFESIMDDFLDKYEVVGRKMVPILPGQSSADKFGTLRRALVGLEIDGEGPTLPMSQEEADYIRERYLLVEDDKRVKEAMPLRSIIGKDKDRWDCETVLSTYSNLENHPRMISVAKRNGKERASKGAQNPIVEQDDESEQGSGSETEQEGTVGYTKVTVKRPKGETAEDRKARKAAVKEERASRRQEKKTRQETFGDERRRQIVKHGKRVGEGGAADMIPRGGLIKL